MYVLRNREMRVRIGEAVWSCPLELDRLSSEKRSFCIMVIELRTRGYVKHGDYRDKLVRTVENVTTEPCRRTRAVD